MALYNFSRFEKDSQSGGFHPLIIRAHALIKPDCKIIWDSVGSNFASGSIISAISMDCNRGPMNDLTACIASFTKAWSA